ncbi:acetamidase/formamidase family protein [Streptomyces sp. NPDC048219]|uniref:acetamidase/formamidase family protein n=1 Tax=Streptomyces TaxID=1883 RepID=UPI003715A051
MPREHRIDPDLVHHAWDASLHPTLRIEPGDTVHFDLKMAGHGQIRHGVPYADTTVDFTTLYHLLGPIYVEGARPGDTLEIEILNLAPGPWGWCAVLPELGLLPDDFPDPFIRYFDLTGATHTELVPGVRVPIRPFLGVMGTLPNGIDTASAFPPHQGGGNVDTRHLTRGATLQLPVFRDGALFSCGDPHAAQGDGEVCVSAIETSMTAALRFTVRQQSISTPRFTVPSPSVRPERDAEGYYGTMGIHADLMEGARTAVRGMIDLVAGEHGLTPQDAYMLCSVAGDLRIFEIVDAGVWNVGFTLPRSVFTAADGR